MHPRTIPVIDWRELFGSSQKLRIKATKQLKMAVMTFGFFTLINHPLHFNYARNVYRVTAQLASPSAEAKQQYSGAHLHFQRGYSLGEIAKGSERVDPKEFWHFGRELPANHPLRQDSHYASLHENIWPGYVPEAKHCIVTYFDEMYAIAIELAPIIDEIADLDKNTIATMLHGGDTIVRCLHYPPVEPTERGVRAASHEDINLYTLLPAANTAGLQVLPREFRNCPDKDIREEYWIDLGVVPESLTVNIGDMLQLHTDFRPRYQSATWHYERVALFSTYVCTSV